MAAVMSQRRDGSGTYTFSSRPRAVQNRKKYRNASALEDENESPAPYGNIMYDRRIVRGNTYAQNVLPATAQPDPIEIQKQQEGKRRAIARKRAKEQLKPRTPEPVEGRKHIDVQTELYLEELTDRVEESDVHTQTDAFLDRPPSPLFIPAKTGVDVSTQILEGELFDFDIEVKPILEVLVGKTVEQALLEVMEEEELANLRAQQRRFEELRNAELVETQRLEEQERRHREEKQRRMRQQLEVLKKEKETSEKIAARAFAQSYLSDLIPSVFGTLNDNGYFYDPVDRDVETYFMPWLMDSVETQLEKATLARKIADSIIRNVVINRHDNYTKLDEEVEKRIRAAIEAARAAAAEKEREDTDATQQESENTSEEAKDDAAAQDENKEEEKNEKEDEENAGEDEGDDGKGNGDAEDDDEGGDDEGGNEDAEKDDEED
ncbi:radial spoke head protein 3 homolog B-like [Rhopilema esculentum]|uniref:radial spoke head protein 3 homolog B-like n=1 Tax=Rhopilema esculentum TaxID=499914 RepID=UPI0031D7F622|eukprot:gene17495-9111_t